MADVPDERLDKVSAHFKPKKGTKYAAIAFLDTPGLMADERKDNPRRLGILREANGLLVVLDGFSGANLADQLTKFREELIFADLDIVSNRADKLTSQLKRNKPAKERELDQAEHDIVKKVQAALEAGQSPRTMSLRPEEEKLIRSFQLLTLKPEMVFVNRGDAAGPLPADLLKLAPECRWGPGPTGARTGRVGRGEPGRVRGRPGHQRLRPRAVDPGHLLRHGPDRVLHGRRRRVPGLGDRQGHRRPVEAAGAIHTDLSKGFVRANVMSYPDFLAAGYEEKNCKTAGTLRQESKEYVVQDGDIMHILANR